jgi:SAM-dependent methyltransferase
MTSLLERIGGWLGLGDDFYEDVLRRLLADGTVSRGMRVLVVCGGAYDRDVLVRLGLRDVTIANLDERMRGDEFAPYGWSFEDAEQLTYPDDAFDAVIAHSGLHHCRSPHRALCEMYRVARRVALVFEPYDGPLARVAVRLGFGQEYELAAVADNGMTHGGLRNTEIPNFVYRWTEAEVRKVVRSYAPVGRQRFAFYYATRVPWRRLRMLRSRVLLGATVAALPLVRLASLLAPRLANNFAFLVVKPAVPADLHPWLTTRDGVVTLDRGWLAARYATADERPAGEPGARDALPPGGAPS